ncbi:sugar phosphate isomerase/epimerase family protein [Faecalicatena orotica]|uniref:sugar phosphate isomerase/epimerase family protein n=1 Tax=Faecalicatena orotica TaxID=1544 RepID=UPI0032180EF4
MKEKFMISGFADEISADFTTQLETVTGLGMHYISLRSANGKGIEAYTEEEVKEQLLPELARFKVQVSSLGSPIGKAGVEDEDGFQKQLKQLDTLCRIAGILNCRYIRIFSFYIPDGKNPEDYRETVFTRMARFLEIAQNYGLVLLHENEKGIFGDTKERCRLLMEEFRDPHLRCAFDFANFVQCKEDTEACWNLLKPYISYIHIKDAQSGNKENVVCGTGDGKIQKLLTRAIREEGYEGFLTLEPHLVLFDSLSSLEKEDAKSVIRENKAKDGAEGYAMQYHALCKILEGM